jgi:hypothetical protein
MHHQNEENILKHKGIKINLNVFQPKTTETSLYFL